MLLKFCCRLNLNIQEGGTALTTAALHGHAPIVKLLLRHGANVNHQVALTMPLVSTNGFKAANTFTLYGSCTYNSVLSGPQGPLRIVNGCSAQPSGLREGATVQSATRIDWKHGEKQFCDILQFFCVYSTTTTR